MFLANKHRESYKMTSNVLVLDGLLEAVAQHFSGGRAYPIDDTEAHRFADVDPWQEDADLSEMHHKVARQMNILWSSSGETPCFPENYNGRQFVRINDKLAHFTGDGWGFTVFRNGKNHYANEMNTAFINNDIDFFEVTTKAVF